MLNLYEQVLLPFRKNILLKGKKSEDGKLETVQKHERDTQLFSYLTLFNMKYI